MKAGNRAWTMYYASTSREIRVAREIGAELGGKDGPKRSRASSAPSRRPAFHQDLKRPYDRCHTRCMKTAVSIPDRVFDAAEKLAARLGVSRSQLYANALASLVEMHREDLITSRLNEIYGPDGEQKPKRPGSN